MEEDEPQKAFDPELNNNMRCFEINDTLHSRS